MSEKMTKQDLNESGIYPCGNRVLVHADQIEEKIKSGVPELDKIGFELLDDTIEAQQSSNASGTLIAAGPDAFQHKTETVYGPNYYEKQIVKELRVSGYSQPFAVPGDRISFAKFAGQKYIGKDGKRYLVLNDEDITCRLDPEVELSDLKIREPAGSTIRHSER
jgi:co-chaperonin GroES (HSP10)